jgi:tetratricopeptide (TPR) repeat protein
MWDKPLALLMAFSSGLGYAAAQDLNQLAWSEAACFELNRTTIALASNGRFEEAEVTLTAGLSRSASFPADRCTGMMLGNLAVVVTATGRMDLAESLAARSVDILERIYPKDHPVLLRPLQILMATRFEQGKVARAREAFQKMQLIRIERPDDCALFRGMAGVLLQREGRWKEGETEYFGALRAWEEAGRGDSMDAASVLNNLGSLYIEARHFDEARRVLDSAQGIFAVAKDVVPLDRIKLATTQGALCARLGQWPEAERYFRDAVSIAGHEDRLEASIQAEVFRNYAMALRKNHPRREARSVEARAVSLQAHPTAKGIVDVTELLAKPKSPKK